MKKSEVNKFLAGIWVRIKDIYNETPWHAALSYPFVFIFFFIIISILIEYLFIYLGINELLVSIYFGKLIFLVPIWILVGLIISKRKFPYIITISIFIGLPLIGMIATSGYEKAAKSNATKVYHAQTVKYISDEIKKCVKGESTFVGGQSCPATAAKAVIGTVDSFKDKNPFNHAKNILRQSNSNINDEDVGYVNLSTSGSNVIIKTCIKKSCNNKENRLQDSIEVQ